MKLEFLIFVGLMNAPKEEDARTIMDKSYDAQRVGVSSKVKMILADGNGKTRFRTVEAKAKEKDGVWRTYTKFTSPPDVAGTQFLVIENEGSADNDLTLYEPVAKRTRSIAPAQRAGRFVGTDYYYEDLDIFDVDEDEHRILRSEKLTLEAGGTKQTFDCWVIESTPRSGKTMTYSKTVTWVEKSNHYPRQVEMFDDGSLAKRFRVFKIQKDGDSLISMLSQMDDLVSKSTTISQTESYTLNAMQIADRIFTESYLLGGG